MMARQEVLPVKLFKIWTEAFKLNIIHFEFSVYQDKHIIHSVNEVSEIRGTLQGLTIHQQ